MAKGATGDTVAVAVARKLVLAALMAVMVTAVVVVTLPGVNTPVLEIRPALADQVTAVFAVPLTLAVKSCCPFEGMFVLRGESEMVMAGLGTLGGAGVGGVPELLLETTISSEVEPDCAETDLSPLCSKAGDGLSDTKSTDLYVPAIIGVPVIEPVAPLRIRPGGKLPVEMRKR